MELPFFRRKATPESRAPEMSADEQLLNAAKKKGLDSVDLALSSGQTTLKGRNKALWEAAVRGYETETRIILENGTSIEARNKSLVDTAYNHNKSNGPEYYSCDWEAVMYLILDTGTTVEGRNLALGYVSRYGSLPLLKTIVKEGVDNIEEIKSAMVWSVNQGNAEKLEILWNIMDVLLSSTEPGERTLQSRSAFQRAVAGIKEKDLSVGIVSFFEDKKFLPTQTVILKAQAGNNGAPKPPCQ
ncbi:MAG: hypothetical protein HY370_05015 [Proteobacteria bacterium]|nr:hypothetical protein [Pseudomonadota bacterium]